MAQHAANQKDMRLTTTAARPQRQAIVIAWADMDGQEPTGRTVLRDGYHRPEFKPALKPRAVIWSRQVNEAERAKADDYAASNGYRVYVMADTKDILERARTSVAKEWAAPGGQHGQHAPGPAASAVAVSEWQQRSERSEGASASVGGGQLTASEMRHAETIASWLSVLSVNSNGGQGVSLRSERPASVAFPAAAAEFEQAKEALGWTYTKVPFAVARRISTIPTEAAWAAKRAMAGDPPLMDAGKAMAIHQYIEAARGRYSKVTSGTGNAASATILTALAASRQRMNEMTV